MKLIAYKYRIYPAAAQVEALNQHFGVSRFVYNTALGWKKDHYQATGKSLSKRDVQDRMVALKSDADFLWLRDVNSQSILAALGNLHTAFKNFFEKLSGFPSFKSRKSNHQAFQCPQHVKVDFERGAIQLPKIGWLKAKLHRAFSGTIKTCTIKRNPAGQYTASVLVEVEDDLPVKAPIDPEKTLGMDLGIKAYLAYSDGQQTSNPLHLNKALDKLAAQQKQLARKKENSHAHSRLRLLVAKTHQRVANTRHDFQHQLTARLCRDNQATSFALENLNVKGMIRNRRLARHIADAAWGSFINKLVYKCDWYGKNLLMIDRWFPSSKQCSCCGTINKGLTLSDRWYDCPKCELSLDRDHNAAIGIRNEGLSAHADKRLQSERNAGCVNDKAPRRGVKSSPKTKPDAAGVLAKGEKPNASHGSPEARSRAA